MTEQDPLYLIRLSQLKEMRATMYVDRRIEIYLDVVTPGPYKEKSVGSALIQGLTDSLMKDKEKKS